MKKKHLLQFLILCMMVLFSCTEEKVPEPFYPKNDHEAYEKSLEQANLLGTALGKEWLQSANEALDNPERIELPYEEAFYINELSAFAQGYRFSAKRGQKVQITLSEIKADTLRRFVDLYRAEEGKLYHVASADSTGQTLGFEPRRDADYVLRVQSELLRGGSFKITFENVPSLRFPVAGLTHQSIWSFWGDERDGGRRSHEGVDIFAERGTPVIAPTDGLVRSAEERGIGGKVVWLADSRRSQNLYFAHLNDWNVKKGDRVKAGDTLGFVGNTGNARTTAPHLHFGIYSRGAINPINHLKPLGRQLRPVDSEFDWLGQEMQLKNNTSLFSSLSDRQATIQLEKNQIARVIAITHDHCKVELPNGEKGFIRKRDLNPGLGILEQLIAQEEQYIYFRPDLSTGKGMIAANENLDVLGRNNDFLLVESASGLRGWIEASKASSVSTADED